MHSRAANEEALISLRAPERAVAFRSIYGLLWPRWCQLDCHSFPSPSSTRFPKTSEYRLHEFQSPKLDPKERIGPYTVLSHPLKIANRLCILILCGIQYVHSRAANEEALICLRAPERAVPFCGTYGLLWPR